MFLHDTFDVSTLVARDDQEPAGVIADSLVGGDRYRQRRRAVGIRAFAEEFEASSPNSSPSRSSRSFTSRKTFSFRARRTAPDTIRTLSRPPSEQPGLTRLLRGVIFHRTVFDYAECRFWPMAAGIQRNDPRAFLRAQGG